MLKRCTICQLWAAFALCAGPLVISCSGRHQQSSVPVAAPSASSASLVFSPSGLSPFDATFTVGACTVTLSASPGSTYQFAPAERQVAIDAIGAAVTACWQRSSGTQGTVYLSAQVGAQGQVSEVVPSPGGALATEVAQCLAGRFATLKLPAPTAAPASLLAFLQSQCEGR